MRRNGSDVQVHMPRQQACWRFWINASWFNRLQSIFRAPINSPGLVGEHRESGWSQNNLNLFQKKVPLAWVNEWGIEIAQKPFFGALLQTYGTVLKNSVDDKAELNIGRRHLVALADVDVPPWASLEILLFLLTQKSCGYFGSSARFLNSPELDH